ncbi:MAG: hypothetical protein ABR907_03535 [Terracidiphilus sp.]|jgi:hypothetical protein
MPESEEKIAASGKEAVYRGSLQLLRVIFPGGGNMPGWDVI